MQVAKNLNLPIFSTGGSMRVKVKKVLENISSDFQDIMVVDTAKFGKCLILDNDMQCAESDHEIYDGEMLKLLKDNDRNILILGGGDGFVAKTALKKNPKLRVTLVDLDAEVINACKKSLNKKGLYNRRLKLCIGDAFFFLEAAKKEKSIKFDGIICDLTDAPIGRKEREAFENFYRQIIIDSHKILKRGGWISIQAGASNTNGSYLNAVGIIEKIINRKFYDVARSNIQIPSYGEKWAFLFGRKK